MNTCEFHEDMKEQVKDHEHRIVSLEKSDAVLANKIDNLCAQLSGLTSWLKGLVVSMIASLVGFFFWYIQNLK